MRSMDHKEEQKPLRGTIVVTGRGALYHLNRRDATGKGSFAALSEKARKEALLFPIKQDIPKQIPFRLFAGEGRDGGEHFVDSALYGFVLFPACGLEYE